MEQFSAMLRPRCSERVWGHFEVVANHAIEFAHREPSTGRDDAVFETYLGRMHNAVLCGWLACGAIGSLRMISEDALRLIWPKLSLFNL